MENNILHVSDMVAQLLNIGCLIMITGDTHIGFQLMGMIEGGTNPDPKKTPLAKNLTPKNPMPTQRKTLESDHLCLFIL